MFGSTGKNQFDSNEIVSPKAARRVVTLEALNSIETKAAHEADSEINNVAG